MPGVPGPPQNLRRVGQTRRFGGDPKEEKSAENYVDYISGVLASHFLLP